MEKHKCKLCSRRFPSGRALGGHMKSHLSNPKTPPKKQEKHTLVSESTQASSSLCYWQEEEEKVEITEEKGVGYGLRENPKKSFRLADPQFLDAAGSVVVVQDRESETETESTQKLLTQRRSKRTRRSMVDVKEMKKKKPKLKKPSSTDSLVDQEPVSSVSNGSPEEDLALCLIMLSKDVWTNSVDSQPRKVKVFNEQSSSKMHECPFCGKRFESGQALGGHKRSHLLKTLKNQDVQSEVEEISNSNRDKIQEVLMIDLNLPAEEDEEIEQDFWAY